MIGARCSSQHCESLIAIPSSHEIAKHDLRSGLESNSQSNPRGHRPPSCSASNEGLHVYTRENGAQPYPTTFFEKLTYGESLVTGSFIHRRSVEWTTRSYEKKYRVQCHLRSLHFRRLSFDRATPFVPSLLSCVPSSPETVTIDPLLDRTC